MKQHMPLQLTQVTAQEKCAMFDNTQKIEVIFLCDKLFKSFSMKPQIFYLQLHVSNPFGGATPFSEKSTHPFELGGEQT